MINFRYCPLCKSELNLSEKYPRCSNCGITFYKNSKPCAGVLPIKDGKVLLSKRAIEPYKGKFDIIGGFLNEGEHPESGAIRETLEETGLKIKIISLLGIYIDQYGKDGDFTLNMHYICEIIGGDLQPQSDVASIHWIDIDKVPTDEGFENTKSALKDLQNWYKYQARF